MKPILVLQHLNDDGPAFLADWLIRQGLAIDLRCSEAGDALPTDASQHGALAVLGGAMSANDALPSLRQAEALIRDAMARGVPVIGHCLGGQLMARALGAAIGPSPRPEVGWHRVEWLPPATDWFGSDIAKAPDQRRAPGREFEVFQWHFESFGLPPGAERLAGSAACPNQAFAIGPHLAMQFHVELDAKKLEIWTAASALDDDYHAALRQHPHDVQTTAAMLHDVERRLAVQQCLAARCYRRWLNTAQR